MKLNLWFHQKVLDKMTRLQWFCQDTKFLNKYAEPLRLYNAQLLDKQIARRHKAGIPVIECSVEWGVE